MTIDEAIRRNKILMAAPILKDDPNAVETFKINIEALKAYTKAQANGWFPPGYKLSGETEE